MPRELKRVLKRMLRVDPEERATMGEIEKEEYFRNLWELPPPRYEKDRRKKYKS